MTAKTYCDRKDGCTMCDLLMCDNQRREGGDGMYNPDEFFKAERHTGFLNPPSSYKNVVTVEGNCVDAHCTNADRIRAMSDEELAEWKEMYYHDCPPEIEACPDEENHSRACVNCWLRWLRQEATT